MAAVDISGTRELDSLRRVATLVASAAPPEEVFAFVAREVADVLDVSLTSILAYDHDGSAVHLGASGEGHPFEVGRRFPRHPGVQELVWTSRRQARLEDYRKTPGDVAARAVAAGIRSAVGVPIVVEGSLWGVAIAMSREDRRLPDDVEARLAGFTELLAAVVANARTREELRRLAEEQAALRRVATLVAREAAPGEVFAAVAEEAARVLDVPLASVVRIGPGDSALAVAGSGPTNPFPTGTRWTLGEGSASLQVARTGRSARVDDYTLVAGEVAARLVASGIRSSVGAPIVVDGRVWGALLALSAGDRALPDGTEGRLVHFTDLVATAISNTEARDAERRLVDEQVALRRIATVVAEGAAPAEVFAAVAEQVGGLLGVDLVNMVRHEDGTAVAVASWSRAGGTLALGTRLPLDGPSIIGTVSRSGRPARVDSYDALPEAITYVVEGVPILAGVGVPILVEGRAWGTLLALSTRPGPLPADTERRLADFTKVVATAIASSEARDGLQRLAGEQASLRRVATLVARGVPPTDVFAAVTEEVAHIFDVPLVMLSRYEPDETVLVIAACGDVPVKPGTRTPLDGPVLAVRVREARGPARIHDYAEVEGSLARRTRAGGVRSGVGAPIVVEGSLHSVMMVLTTEPTPLPADTEVRLARFCELVATAIANAQARDEVRRLADEQAALRRVATLVALGVPPAEVFAAVAEEVAQILEVPIVQLSRYEPDDTMLVIAVRGDFPVQPGTRWPLDGPILSAKVRDTGLPARIESYGGIGGALGAVALEAGIRSSVGAPIFVDGKLHSVMMVLSREVAPLPPGTEARLAGFTELLGTAIANTQARDDLRRLADEQAALRRVATLVARRTPPEDLFRAVVEEVGGLLEADFAQLYAYDEARATAVYVANWTREPDAPPLPSRMRLDGPSLSRIVRDTRLPTRIDHYDEAPGSVGDTLVRPLGMRAGIGCPVIVDGELWGTMAATRSRPEPFAAGAELRLAAFTDLVATAISNASTQTALVASRARIVAAGDEARRRIERDLHDGTQQRLVALGLDLQTLQAQLPGALAGPRAELGRLQRELDAVLEDVREISRGLHPAILSHAGLAAAVRSLARRSPVPVELELDVDARLPDAIEVAAYYVVSEALTNTVKHAEASLVLVGMSTGGGWLRVSVRDDGRGGAAATPGSGLVGLEDRVEALGGRLLLDSPRGVGTTVTAELPLSPPIAQADAAADAVVAP